MNASPILGAALAATLAIFGGAAQAAPITSNPTLSSGALTFSDFTATVTTQGAAAPGTASAVDVSLLGGGAAGIQISSGFTALGAPGVNFADAAITYVARGTAGVTSVGLSFDGYFLGLAVASVTEAVYADAARSTLLGSMVVTCSLAGCNQTTSVALDGSYDVLYITKDINVTAFQGGIAQSSIITQSFGTTPVPEPMSLALFGTGLVGLGLVRRARKQG